MLTGPNSPIAEAPIIERKLPSKAEILKRATELYLKGNGRFQDLLGSNPPTEGKLREEGFLNKAKLDLMRTPSGNAERQVNDYIGNLKNELEAIGFTILPLNGY